jgi:flagellar biosynthesis protein FliP
MTTTTATSSKIKEEGATANQEPAQTQEIECQAWLDSGSILPEILLIMTCYYNYMVVTKHTKQQNLSKFVVA